MLGSAPSLAHAVSIVNAITTHWPTARTLVVATSALKTALALHFMTDPTMCTLSENSPRALAQAMQNLTRPLARLKEHSPRSMCPGTISTVASNSIKMPSSYPCDLP